MTDEPGPAERPALHLTALRLTAVHLTAVHLTAVHLTAVRDGGRPHPLPPRPAAPGGAP
ncbi:hypothetical protein [Kitasatospora sp. NPDC056731]|uniref:hypothetical protein n=1 Tax=Kitasatospora sp. NPDC056731 TaxID=3155422 RepID=UPI003430AD68